MHEANTGKSTPEQDQRSLGQKRSDAARKRWARAKALKAGFKLLEDQAKEPKATPAPIPPPPATPEGWQEKIRDKLWAALNQNNENGDRILLALAKFLDLAAPSISEEDLQDLERIRRIRAMTDAELAEQRKQLLAVIERPRYLTAQSLPKSVRVLDDIEADVLPLSKNPEESTERTLRNGSEESIKRTPPNKLEEAALLTDAPPSAGSVLEAITPETERPTADINAPRLTQCGCGRVAVYREHALCECGLSLPRPVPDGIASTGAPVTYLSPTVLPSGQTVKTPEPAPQSPVTARPRFDLPSPAIDPGESEISALSRDVSKR